MKLLNLFILASLLIIPMYAVAGEKLTGDEIKSTFEGNTYSWKHAKRSDSGKEYLDPSGKTTGVKNGKSREGSWSVKGNQICLKNVKSSVCRDVERAGDGKFYLVKNGNKRVSNITKVEPGNTL